MVNQAGYRVHGHRPNASVTKIRIEQELWLALHCNDSLHRRIVLNEIRVQLDGDEEVFGYQERYAEYRYKPSLITGQFRSQFDQSLDIWHLAQDFAATPKLNSDFIEDNPPGTTSCLNAS